MYWFENAGDPVAFIGSADLMHRNLDRRVEVLVEMPTPELVAEIGWILDLAFDPTTKAWSLGADGAWTRNDGTVDLQAALIERQRARRKKG